MVDTVNEPANDPENIDGEEIAEEEGGSGIPMTASEIEDAEDDTGDEDDEVETVAVVDEDEADEDEADEATA